MSKQRDSMNDARCVDRLIDFFGANRHRWLDRPWQPRRANQSDAFRVDVAARPCPPVAKVSPKSRGIPRHNRCQNRQKIGPARYSGHPISTSGHPVRSRGVPGASRSVPGAPRERPKGAPGEVQDAPRILRAAERAPRRLPSHLGASPIDSKSRPKVEKNTNLSHG